MRHTILLRQVTLTVGTAPFVISVVSVPCSRGCRSTRRAREVPSHALLQFGNAPRHDCPHAHLSLKNLVAACAVTLSLQAHADSALFTGYAHGAESVDFKLTASDLTTVLAQGSTTAGGVLMSFNDAPSFEPYCVDLFQHISFGATY